MKNFLKKILLSNYINDNLMNEEKVIYYGKIHWLVYFPAIFSLLFSIFMFLIYEKPTIIIGTVLLVYSLFTALKSYIYILSTEFGITNKRVISKIGLISRETVELNHNKIESLQVDQSVIGRILNYGNLKIIGTGGSISIIPMIEDPMNFRKKSLEIIHSN